MSRSTFTYCSAFAEAGRRARRSPGARGARAPARARRTSASSIAHAQPAAKRVRFLRRSRRAPRAPAVRAADRRAAALGEAREVSLHARHERAEHVLGAHLVRVGEAGPGSPAPPPIRDSSSRSAAEPTARSSGERERRHERSDLVDECPTIGVAASMGSAAFSASRRCESPCRRQDARVRDRVRGARATRYAALSLRADGLRQDREAQVGSIEERRASAARRDLEGGTWKLNGRGPCRGAGA